MYSIREERVVNESLTGSWGMMSVTLAHVKLVLHLAVEVYIAVMVYLTLVTDKFNWPLASMLHFVVIASFISM